MNNPTDPDPGSDGFIPPEQLSPGGCGLTGCLTGAMALFAILLVAMLVLALLRFGSRGVIPGR